MDLSRGMDDMVMFKVRQEDLDESLREIIKSIDALNAKFEGYVSKKDLDVFREDMMIIKKQIESVNKVLPLVDLKLPQEIIDLRREREDILLLLRSLQDQYENKKIDKSEYMSFKEGNQKRMEEIDRDLPVMLASAASKNGVKRIAVVSSTSSSFASLPRSRYTFCSTRTLSLFSSFLTRYMSMYSSPMTSSISRSI
jgi:hypothetical protein